MRRGDEKKQAILDVAERLFYHKGYEQTTVQDILNVLDASKGSFYHHFESKFTVLETLCVQRSSKALEEATEAAGRETRGLNRVSELLHYTMPLRLGEEKFMALLLPIMFTAEGRTLYTQYSQALRDTFAPQMLAALYQAADEGDIHLYHPAYTADLLMALINQCWYDTAKTIMDAKHRNSTADDSMLMELLQAYRFAMERILDAPFGCLDIVRLPELMETIARVLIELKLS